MELFENFASAPAITVLCFFGAHTFKSFTPEGWNKYIPSLCAALGLLLGLVCYFLIPGYVPAENPVVAAAVGAVSGWAATGLHQSIKQVKEDS